MALLRLITDLGAEVLVRVEGSSAQEIQQAVVRTLREYGQMGPDRRAPRHGYRGGTLG